MNFCSMEGKVALITGGSAGIGEACGRLFAKAGAKVVLVARREEKLKKICEEIRAEKGVAEYVVADISKEEDCKRAVDECVAKFGRLDTLLTCAGVATRPGDFAAQFDTEEYRRFLSVDLDGVVFSIKYAYPAMEKSGGGSIINYGSVAALVHAGTVPYTVSKGAIRALTTQLAVDMAPMNIRVNAIYPGLTATEMTAGAQAQPAFLEKTFTHVPMHRLGTAEEIANCSLFLASDEASFVTGAHLSADGGWVSF